MDSTPLQAAQAWAKEYDAQLRADDPRFNMSVTIIHEDGTVMLLQNAFAVVRKERVGGVNWVYVFTEHHGTFIYDRDEIRFGQQGPNLPVKPV